MSNPLVNNNNPGVIEQLVQLRELSKHTEIIHEAQALQLRIWPMMIITHAQSSEAQIFWSKRQLDYVINKVDDKPPEDLSERLKLLDEATKWLLGDEWLIRVKIAGKFVYRGMRKTDYEPRIERRKSSKQHRKSEDET